MATHSSVLAWRLPGTGEPGGCRLWGRTESDTTEATWRQKQPGVTQKYSQKEQTPHSIEYNFTYTSVHRADFVLCECGVCQTFGICLCLFICRWIWFFRREMDGETYCYINPTLSHFSCVQLCNPMDCSLPGSSVYKFLQARILQWINISSYRRSSWCRDRICISCLAGTFFTLRATWETHINP